MKKVILTLIILIFTVIAYSRPPYKIEGNNVIVDIDVVNAKCKVLKVEIWSEKTIKIISDMDKELSQTASLITSGQPTPVKFKVAYVQNNLEIQTKFLSITVQEDGLVRVFNREGNKLIIESDRAYEQITSAEGKYKIHQRFFLNVHEHIYGFGFNEGETRYSLRDKSFLVQQSFNSIASPILYSERGYAFIWDNFSATQFADKKSGLEISSEYADEIQYFVIYGPSWNEIVAEIRNLTGTTPLLPRWAFGHWAFPGNYSSADALNLRVERYHESGIPTEVETTTDYSLFEEEKSITANPESQKARIINAAAYDNLKPKYADLRNTTINRRLCIPTYINIPGIQSFGSFLVAGEASPTWKSFKGQVTAAVNLPLSGQPYWSTNIGGTGMPALSGLELSELLTRWYQFAVFTPVLRAANPDRDLLKLKEFSANHFDAAIDAVTLRYKLMPYIYSTANDVATENATITRSLLFDYLKVEKTHPVELQYMFGKSIMVCPVTEPDAKQIQVYFPEGNDWIDFYTGTKYEGNSTQKIDVSIKEIPVFVKTGSIIPLATTGLSTEDSLSSPIELRIFPGQNAKFVLYDDNGKDMQYASGQKSSLTIEYNEKDKSVSFGQFDGNFPGMITERLFRIVMASDTTGVGNNLSEQFQEVAYKGKKMKVKITQP
jgi:alpha-glucosidase (family GH31 glycosyl hydrolase)